MEVHERTIRISGLKGKDLVKQKLLGVGVIGVLFVVWFFAAKVINKNLILPDFVETMKQFFSGWVDKRTMSNLVITLKRVLTGSAYAIVVGTVIGLLMGYSDNVMRAISPIINSVRQVPIMAWVPISIVWFGLGEGPTVFLIFMSAVFPLIINTIAGVRGIDPDYINAARSMGASTKDIYLDVVIPGALPGFLTGCRLAIGLGWMSVICAEFIATSKGFGYLMIEAQERLQTPKLYALMIMSAIVGFFMDQLIRLIERKLTGWRFADGQSEG